MVSPASVSKRKINQIQGVQIVKIAAFCFAVISWIATATGLSEYVFDQYWQALLISFAIQSILFVFNLKLPYYFARLKRKGFFTWLLRIIIILFYAGLLFTSSWFSYVYISNMIYKNTTYIDANIELDSNYRKFLYNTEEYIDAYISYLEENSISFNLAQLKTKLEAGSSNASSTPIEELKYDLEKAKLELEAKEKELDSLLLMQDTAEQIYKEPMSERWRSKSVREQEKEEFTNAMNMVAQKQAEIIEVKEKIIALENEIGNFKESHEDIIRDFMVEIAKDEPNLEVLNQYVTELHSRIIDNEEIPEVSTGYIEIVSSSQALLETIGKYSNLRTVRNEMDNILNELASGQASIPDPAAEDYNLQIEIWINYWKNNYSKLERAIKALPQFWRISTELSEPSPVLMEYDSQAISDHMDILQRNYLAGINPMERAMKLLFSRFNFLAVASLIFALFLDVSSLLAGLFIYLISIKKTENGRKVYVLDVSKGA